MLQSIASRWQSVHPDNFRIARAALWVLLFTFFAKLAVAGREVTLAWRYGLGAEIDAYNLALTLATWFPVTLLSVMTIVLVPILVQMRSVPLAARRRFLAEINGVGLAAGALLMGAVWLVTPALVESFAGTLSASTRTLTEDMLHAFAPLALLTVLAGVHTARLQAIEDHRYTLAEGFPALVVIVAVIAWQLGGPVPLIIGTLLGVVMQVVWLAKLGTKGEGRVGIRWPGKTLQWHLLGRSVLIVGAGQFAISFAQPLDQYFAASLGSGAVAALGYTNRLIGLGMTLGAAVIARATLPIFAEGIALGQQHRICNQAHNWALLMLGLGSLGTSLLWILAPWLVSALFERGAFTTHDTEVVAAALRWGVWQLPFYLAGLVLVSLLASQQRYLTIALIATTVVICKCVANVVLSEWLGLNGIFLATCIMYAFSMALCWTSIWKTTDRNG